MTEMMQFNDWYDYGARFYDPQIGRWQADQFFGNHAEESPGAGGTTSETANPA